MNNNRIYQTTYSLSGEGPSPSMAVVEVVAEGKDVSPSELPPLYETVDPVKLDALIQECRPDRVRFSYCGYEVTVLADKRIRARKLESRWGSN